MRKLLDFLIGPFLIWLPSTIFLIVFLIAVFLYLRRNKPLNRFGGEKLKKAYKYLIVSYAVFRIIYAGLLTAAQYYMWVQGGLEKLLAIMPDSQIALFNFRHGYFLFYAFGRFWLNALVSIGVAYLFYLFLIFLKKYNERFFEDGEVELGFLMALIVGWPNFVIFIPCVFISVILISIIRRTFMKEAYTTLGWPFILATLIMFVFGNKLVEIFKLGVLKI